MKRSLHCLIALLTAHGMQAQFPLTREIDARIGQQRPAITVIAQDMDGMIWAGSNMGLLRLDGDRVDVMLPVEKERITALAADKDGMLAALNSGVLVHFANGKCDTLYQDTILERSPARALAVDANGTVYVGTYGAGVLIIAADGGSRIAKVQGLPDDHVNDICLLANGHLAVATDQGLAMCSGNTVSQIYGEGEGAPDNLVLSVTANGYDQVWAGTDQGGAFLWKPSGHVIVDRIEAMAAGGAVNAILAHDGHLWLGVRRNGPLLFDQGQRTNGYHLEDAPQGGAHPALSLLADREGVVWWCDGSDHLYRADPAVLIIPQHDKDDLKHITALCIDHARVWYATAAGLFSHDAAFADTSRSRHVPLTIDPRTPIVSLDAGADGTIWAATFGSGLFAIHPDGRIDRYDARNGPIDPNVLSVCVREDEVWVATLTGMSVFRDGRVTRYASPLSGFMFMALPLTDGSVLGATDGSGVVRFDGRRLRQVSTTGPRTFYSIAQDTAGTVWAVGPESGLCEVQDTALVRVGGDRPIFQGDLYALTTIRDRVLVFGSVGCTAYDPLEGSWTDLTTRLGLDGLQAELNAVRHDPSGALWLACNKGLVRLRADDHWFDPVLSTVITDMVVGNSHILVKPEWNTTYDRNAITFRFTAPYYDEPDAVGFEYRLEGLNDRTVRTREREVSYPALSPGSYTFKVRAYLGEDATNAAWATVRIRVDPPWWRRWWVVTGALIIALLLLAWAIRARERRISYRQRMEQEQVRFQLEALRSQVDPHFLFNSFNTLVELIETEPEKAVEHVEELSTFFRNILQLRDRTMITLGEELHLLHTYFGLEQRRFGESIRLDVEVSEKDKRMCVVPLVLQMLVENAVKHNSATLQDPIIIQVSSVEGMLMVSNSLHPRISLARSTGFGLDSIRKRYAALGKLSVEFDHTPGRFIVRIPLIPPVA